MIIIYDCKFFIVQATEPNVISLFMPVDENVYNKLEYYIFQPSLMLLSKAEAYRSEAPFRCSTLG